LAVVEHLSPTSLVSLFKNVYRTLEPNGKLIITTPAAWSNGLLRIFARIRLVSKEEIDEHEFVYTLPLLCHYLVGILAKPDLKKEMLNLDILNFISISGRLLLDSTLR
jgi:hypothetical protein